MEGESGEEFANTLDDIAFLSRSQNRVTILEALVSERQTRGELTDQTGIASTTVGRILNELSERDWVERTDEGTYSATPIGRQVVDEFLPLVEAMSVIRRLGETVAWIQAADEPLELQYLVDATVRRPEPADPMAPTTAYMEDLRSAAEFQCLVGVAPPESFEKAMRDGAVDRGMEAVHVITKNEFTYLLDYPDRLARWRDYIEAGATVYCYDGSIPCNVFTFDETAYIANVQSEYGDPYTTVESENEEVLAWAHALIDRYRADAKELTVSDFTASPSE